MADQEAAKDPAVDVSSFKEQGVAQQPTPALPRVETLAGLRLKDVKWRIDTRPRVGWTIIWLLIGQNIAVALGLAGAGITGSLARLVPLFLGIASATLVETAAIVQIVVRWLFSEIDYGAK